MLLCLLPLQIDYMFDVARKTLESAAWNKKRKVWKQAVDVATGRKYFYNTRTLESRWYMPIMERQNGEDCGIVVTMGARVDVPVCGCVMRY